MEMKIKTDRIMRREMVRDMCIRYHYCTNCCNIQYSALLDRCDTHPTDTDVLNIAGNILAYSDVNQLMSEASCTYEELLESICFNLINECTYTAVEIIK